MNENLKNIKENVIRQLVGKEEEFDVSYTDFSDPNFPRRVETLVKAILRNDKVTLSESDHNKILGEVTSYLIGWGPLNVLLKDPDVSEIMVNGPHEIYVEKKGSLEKTDLKFKDEHQLEFFIDKIVSPVGKRISQFEPYVDARMEDGSRVNIIKAPVSNMGSILTIRKLNFRKLNLQDLVELNTLSAPVADFLAACVKARINILISGGAGSGKTTLLNALGSLIPNNERVITIEDTRELSLEREHTIPLETRTANIEGKGEITIRYLIRNALHMRPDRIIVGEVRSVEVLDIIQAMNTGHEGSLTTLHANSALEALDRLEVLSILGNSNMSGEVAKRQIISAIDLIIQIQRLSDGSRKVVQISEVVKTKEEQYREYQLQDIAVLADRTTQGSSVFTSTAPSFYAHLKKKVSYSCDDFEIQK